MDTICGTEADKIDFRGRNKICDKCFNSEGEITRKKMYNVYIMVGPPTYNNIRLVIIFNLLSQLDVTSYKVPMNL